MTAMDYINETVKLTDQEFADLIQTIKKLEKENKKLKAKVTKLEDDVRYYKNLKSYNGWDGGGGF